MKKYEWVDGLEASGILGFKDYLFIGIVFVVPSLNVATKTNLWFIPF